MRLYNNTSNKTILVLCLVLIICSVTLSGFAQQKISFPSVPEMSPNAASITQYQDCPVSYYSGTPEISIPLYEIDVDGFKLPIALNYHASGIRVAQEASWVGLGWSLNVGGTISRSVKCVDDFMVGRWDELHPWVKEGFYYAPKLDYIFSQNIYYPNCYEIGNKPNAPGVFAAFELQQIYDSEPDIFYYSLPSFSGKFIFDNNKKTTLFNKEHNLVFEYDDKIYRGSFTVKDGNGNIYIFKDCEMSQNYKMKGYINKNYTENNRKYDVNTSAFWTGWYSVDEYEFAPQNPHKYVSCWYLSEIITSKNRHIYFTYEHEDQYMPAQESYEVAVGTIAGETMDNYYTSKTINEALRLTRIDYDFGHVIFNSSKRLDINSSKSYPSKKLDCISIYNSENKPIKDITFDYDYFNSEKEGTDCDYVFLRLKLKSVLESNKEQPYVFSYEDTYSMPAKNSKNADYWGYYNGRKYGATYNIAAIIYGEYYDGVSKAANPKYATTYTLNKIKYPTGGYETFEYESPEISPYFTYRVPADNGLSGYPIQTDFSIHLSTYHNTGLNEYEDLPASDTLIFEVKNQTKLAITCQIEGGTDNKDPNFNYSYWFGEIQRENGSHVCWLWNEYPPTSYALNYERNSTDPVWTVVKKLDSGIYKFCTGELPAEVSAEWKIDDGKHCSTINVLSEDSDVSDRKNAQRKETGNEPEYGGGLRIKSIQSDVKKRYFTYDGGKMLVEPILTYDIQRYVGNLELPFTVMTSESTAPMSTFQNGNIIGYDCVTETVEDDDCPSYTKYYYKNEGEYELQDDNFYDGPVNINYTDGLLEKKEVYWDDILLKQNIYDYTSTHSDQIDAIYDRSGHYYSDDHLNYRYIVEWPKLSKEIETIYDTKDENKKMVVTKTFTYNDHDLVSQETTNDGLSSYKNIIYYPFDFALQQPIYKQMAYNNIVSVPVEIVRMKDNAVIGATRANYQNINNMFLIKTHDELDLSVPTSLSDFRKYYSCKETFDYDENFGSLRQYSNSSGKLLTYLWGYNYQYPIATIENARYSDVESLLGGADKVKAFLSKGGYEDVFEVLGFLGPIAPGHLKNAYTNIYAYKPLVGMRSHMDVNGNLTHYYYDSENRLWYVKDAQQKTIKKYNYNIKK